MRQQAFDDVSIVLLKSEQSCEVTKDSTNRHEAAIKAPRLDAPRQMSGLRPSNMRYPLKTTRGEAGGT